MQFITFYSPDMAPTPGAQPNPKHMEEMGQLMADMTAKGVLVATGAIMRAAEGAHVTLGKGDYKIRNGADQVLEAKAVGFAIPLSQNKETPAGATAFSGRRGRWNGRRVAADGSTSAIGKGAKRCRGSRNSPWVLRWRRC